MLLVQTRLCEKRAVLAKIMQKNTKKMRRGNFPFISFCNCNLLPLASVV